MQKFMGSLRLALFLMASLSAYAMDLAIPDELVRLFAESEISKTDYFKNTIMLNNSPFIVDISIQKNKTELRELIKRDQLSRLFQVEYHNLFEQLDTNRLALMQYYFMSYIDMTKKAAPSYVRKALLSLPTGQLNELITLFSDPALKCFHNEFAQSFFIFSWEDIRALYLAYLNGAEVGNIVKDMEKGGEGSKFFLSNPNSPSEKEFIEQIKITQEIFRLDSASGLAEKLAELINMKALSRLKHKYSPEQLEAFAKIYESDALMALRNKIIEHRENTNKIIEKECDRRYKNECIIF